MKRLFFFCVFLFFLAACGKKIPLNLNAYQEPAPPSGLQAKETGGLLTLSWSYPVSKNLAGFVIERKCYGAGHPDGDFKVIARLVKEMTFTDKIEPGKTCLYHLRAKNLKDMLSEAAELKSTPSEAPPPPAGLAFRIGDDSVTITWEAQKKAESYDVSRKIAENEGESPILLTPSPVKENSVKDATLPANAVTYLVSSVLVEDKVLYESLTSDITIKPADYIPKKVFKPDFVFTAEGVMLIWESNSERWVSGYRIYKKTGLGFEKIGQSAVPSFVDATGGKAPAYYRIAAYSSGAEGPSSDVLYVPAAPVLK